MKKIYFPGLNGLRFIGAFVVIIGHIEFLKSVQGLPNLMHVPFYKNTSGHLGVILFFVLSGFLITYLLLNELKEKSTIHIWKFYMRRVLRIWPLYYFMILISIFLIPLLFSFFHFSITKPYTWSEIKYYLFFLPNISKSMGSYINGAVHLWSIGVEEQFYILWPLLMLVFRKYTLLLLLAIFFGITITPLFLGYLNYRTDLFSGNELFYNRLSLFIIHFKINSMAIGGFIAYVVFKKKKWLEVFKLDFIEIILFVGTLLLWLSGTVLTQFNDEIYSLLFGIIILNIATKSKPVITLENNFFTFMGKISYGLYVYHWIVILTIIEVLKKSYVDFKGDIVEMNIILYSTSITLTIVISYLSFHYLEKPFVQWKTKFD